MEAEEIIEIRQIKYLNNIVEQDHRFIKKRTRPTLGFKNFHSAAATITGIENIRIIQKGQVQSIIDQIKEKLIERLFYFLGK